MLLFLLFNVGFDFHNRSEDKGISKSISLSYSDNQIVQMVLIFLYRGPFWNLLEQKREKLKLRSFFFFVKVDDYFQVKIKIHNVSSPCLCFKIFLSLPLLYIFPSNFVNFHVSQ